MLAFRIFLEHGQATGVKWSKMELGERAKFVREKTPTQSRPSLTSNEKTPETAQPRRRTDVAAKRALHLEVRKKLDEQRDKKERHEHIWIYA